MPKVAFYARYSSDLQNPESIGDQLSLCRQLAMREGWDIVEVYQDAAISGASIRGRAGMLRLLDDARAGRFDILCAEALDRISRDQEDIAHVYKLLRFKGIVLHTVAEGRTDEMHIGLKGTMNAIFLKDLAEKTRRGQRGRVEKGRSGGGLAYGYSVMVDAVDGAGGRAIDEHQASVIRRIFKAFAEGTTPGAIADMLNRDGVSGPVGRSWKATPIRGHRIRGTGIINNGLYRGILVWNRQSFVKDPLTGKRQARMNPQTEWVMKEVPALRIVDESLWQAVKERQVEQEQRHAGLRDAVRKARVARSRSLIPAASNFTRLLTCVVCGADFCLVGRDRYGCADHYRRKTCVNSRTLQRRKMEEGVRALFAETAALMGRNADLLREHSDPTIQRLCSQITLGRRELEATDAKLDGLLAAIEDGLYTPRIKIRFQQLEDQVQRLKAKLQVETEHLKARNVLVDENPAEAVISLMAELRTNDDEYAILKLRRYLGPISVAPEASQGSPTLRWQQEHGEKQRRRGSTKDRIGADLENPESDKSKILAF